MAMTKATHPQRRQPAYVRPKDLPNYVPFTTNTAYRLARQKKFPRPIRLSKGISAWKMTEVDAWLASKEGK